MGMDQAYFKKPNNDLTREALDWNPRQGRRTVRTRMTWRRTTDEEIDRIRRVGRWSRSCPKIDLDG
jgi:hypothetical protein